MDRRPIRGKPARPFHAPLVARRGDQRGQILVLFTLMLVVLLLVSALAVDYGSWLVSRRSYQNVADAAALAGAQQLSRPLDTACASGASKNQCAREAAWQSVKSALGFTSLDPSVQAQGPDFTDPYVENGYSVWVASPPTDAGTHYPGHLAGRGLVFVRVEHDGPHFLSRIAFPVDTPVTAWATAGRFPANFAVIGMCDPSTGGTCLANDSNIKIDGTNSLLAVVTGDIGTNAWTKTSGSGSAIGLSSDSNAYMGLFEDCWNAGGNQCNLYGYDSGAVNYSDVRAATPLGASIVDPGYPAPPISNTTTPMQCYPGYGGTVRLASVTTAPADSAPQVQTADVASDLVPAAAVIPPTPAPVVLGAAKPQISGTVTAAVGGAVIPNITVVANPGGFSGTTNASGVYAIKNVNASTTYTLTATDAAGTFHTTTVPNVVVGAVDVVKDFTMQHNPIITGTIRVSGSGTPIPNAGVVVNGPTGPFSTTANGSGVYTVTVGDVGTYTVAASATGYSGNSASSGSVALDATKSGVDVYLTPLPTSVTGTITDATTNLPIPGVTVSLSTGGSATTNASGQYTFSTTSGSATYTLSGTAFGSGTTLDGYVPGSSSPALTNQWKYSATLNTGSNTQNFSLWPTGCSTQSRNYGSWSCAYPSGSNCPATTNADASTVNCTFTQANAIRPGTYQDISVNGCAWIDPKGGVTGLGSGQYPGIVHITGTLSMSNNSYIFGDGVTIVMDTTASINVGNGGGFVLNFGSQVSGGSCDYSTIKEWNDGTTPCFRTVSDGQDYAYAAWTTAGHSTWANNCTSASPTFSKPPVYDVTDCVNVGTDLGVTFYLYGTPSGGGGHRFNISTANMGYLFNGVLYGPNDDIALGGGKDGQTAAGQIVGYTIEYHGGTKIIQRWYADPVDGPPFLIEPILGECVAPIIACH